MNNLNLPPFYIGQKVIYITGINMPKDSIHVISEIFKKPCGCINIEIDNKRNYYTTNKKATYWECKRCKSLIPIYPPLPNQRGWNPNSFKPIEEINIPLLTFKEIKKIEKEEILILN